MQTLGTTDATPSLQIKLYMKQLCDGLNHLHSNGIMHRDVKSSNVLIDNHGIVKLADFGLARRTLTHLEHPRFTKNLVTRWYRYARLCISVYDSPTHALGVLQLT